MFPRKKRLNREVFPHIQATGKRISTGHFSAVSSKEGFGYAVVISKKTIRLATSRNRAKRKVLAALKSCELPSSLILFPKTSAANLSPTELKTELTALLSKISK